MKIDLMTRIICALKEIHLTIFFGKYLYLQWLHDPISRKLIHHGKSLHVKSNQI
jgi:hypothetical protein